MLVKNDTKKCGRMAFLMAMLSLCPLIGYAGAIPLSRPSTNDAGAPLTNVVFQKTGPNEYRLDKITINAVERSIAFPATVNMNKGPVEYFLVGEEGKIHESVLRTMVSPYQIHAAMLMLNATGAPKGLVMNDYSKPVPGDPVSITVSWEHNGDKRMNSAEAFVLDRSAGKSMTAGNWTFNGSRIVDGFYIAQRDRSIVAIIGDIDAVFNNPRPRRDQDDNWLVNADTCPPVDTPVTVKFTLKNKPK